MKETKTASQTWCSSRVSLTEGSAIRNIALKVVISAKQIKGCPFFTKSLDREFGIPRLLFD